MTHIYFILYFLALLSGIVLFTTQYIQFKTGQITYPKSYFIYYTLYTVIILFLTISSYIVINISQSDVTLVILSAVLLTLSSVFIPVLANYLTERLHWYHYIPVFLLIVTLPVLFISKRELVLIVTIITQLISINVVIPFIITKAINRRHNGLLFFLLSSLIILIEVLLLRFQITPTTMILSISIIYLTQNILNLKKTLKFEKRDISSFGLTKKEMEVTEFLKKGLTNKEIAYEMGVSANTIKNHIYNIYKKTNSTSRIEYLSKIVQIS